MAMHMAASASAARATRALVLFICRRSEFFEGGGRGLIRPPSPIPAHPQPLPAALLASRGGAARAAHAAAHAHEFSGPRVHRYVATLVQQVASECRPRGVCVESRMHARHGACTAAPAMVHLFKLPAPCRCFRAPRAAPAALDTLPPLPRAAAIAAAAAARAQSHETSTSVAVAASGSSSDRESACAGGTTSARAPAAVVAARWSWARAPHDTHPQCLSRIRGRLSVVEIREPLSVVAIPVWFTSAVVFVTVD